MRQVGGRGEINPETDHHPVRAALEQDSSELLPQEEHVVGPFEHDRLARHSEVDCFNQREASGERERLRLRIAGAKVDDGASVEIAGRRNPLATLSPFS